MFSSSRAPAVVVYPDSDKIGVFPGDEADELIFKRGTAVPWAERRAGTRPSDGLLPSGGMLSTVGLVCEREQQA